MFLDKLGALASLHMSDGLPVRVTDPGRCNKSARREILRGLAARSTPAMTVTQGQVGQKGQKECTSSEKCYSVP